MADNVSKCLALSLFLCIAFAPLSLNQYAWAPSHFGRILFLANGVHSSLEAGHFPVRWVERFNNGYGGLYPQAISPAAHYISWIFKAIAGNTLAGLTLTFIFLTIIAFIGVFLSIRIIFGEWAAFIASTLYLFAPPRIAQVYALGDLEGYAAGSFLPWILFFSLAETNHENNLIGLVISSALTTYADITGIIGAATCIIFILGFKNNSPFASKMLWRTILAICWGILIACSFWGPPFFEAANFNMQPDHAISDSVSEHLIFFNQWFQSTWGGEQSKSGPDDAVPFQLGNLHALMALFAIANIFRKPANQIFRFLPIFLFMLFLFFIESNLSKIVWVKFPSLQIVRFPFKLQWIVCFIICLLGSSLFDFRVLEKMKSFSPLFILTISVLIVFNEGPLYQGSGASLAELTNQNNLNNDDQISHGETKISPINFSHFADPSLFRLLILSGDAHILSFIKDSFTEVTVDIDANALSKLQANVANYDGWAVTGTDKEKIIISSKKYEPIEFSISPGRQIVSIKFERTRIMRWADGVSLSALAALILFSLRRLLPLLKRSSRHVL